MNSQPLDPYTLKKIQFAETWRSRMDKRIEKGEEVQDIALETALQLGAIIYSEWFGDVVLQLAYEWEHGNQLLTWYRGYTRTWCHDRQ